MTKGKSRVRKKGGTPKVQRSQPDLPPDPYRENENRGASAMKAVKAYRKATATDEGDLVGDLLADLMHLCDRQPRLGVFEECLNRAYRFYAEETEKI